MTDLPPPPPPGSQPGWAPPPPPAGPPPGWLPPPPGTPGYGYGYAPGAPPLQARPMGGVATALRVLVGLAGVASLGVAGALANRAAVLGDGFAASFDDVQRADDLAIGTAGLSLVAMLATMVLWLVWQYRHAQNAATLGARGGLGPGWAIAGWLIPLGSLVLGPLQLAQSARASDPATPGGRGTVPGVVYLWWALWVGQTIVGLASGRFGFQQDDLASVDDLEAFRSADQVGSAGALVMAGAAAAAVVMIGRLTARQREAFAQRGVTVS